MIVFSTVLVFCVYIFFGDYHCYMIWHWFYQFIAIVAHINIMVPQMNNSSNSLDSQSLEKGNLFITGIVHLQFYLIDVHLII